MPLQLTVDGHPLLVDIALQLEAWNYVPPAVAAPTNLRTTATTSSTISLAWTGPAGTYTLQRAPVTNGTVGAFATIYTGTTANYQDMGLAFITTYAYRVLVTVNGVASPYSTVLQATTAGGNSTADLYADPYRDPY